MFKMKLFLCHIVFLSCFGGMVFGSTSDSSENSHRTVKPKPNRVEFLDGLVNYFKDVDEKNQELEKSHEDLKEQFVLLSKKFEELENRISEDSGVWLLTPPIRGPPGEKGPKGDPAGFRGSKSTSIRPATPLPLQTNTGKVETEWEINRPGENWIVANEISHWDPDGRWGDAQLCPPATFVTAFFTYFLNSGLFEIELTCTNKYNTTKGENDHLLRVKSADVSKITAIGEEWDIRNRGSRTSFARGLSLNRRILERRGSTPEIRKMSKTYDLIYHGQNPKESASNSSGSATKCPENHAICGLIPMMDNKGLGILSTIGFKCCDICTPEEKWVTVYQFNNTESSNVTVKFNSTVGFQQSLQNLISNSTNLDVESAVDSIGISPPDFYQEFSAHLAKSNSTGFDWTATEVFMETEETNLTKTFTCGAQSACVYQQLVGQCGSVQIPVDNFCQGSAPVGSGIPDSCTDSKLTSCSDAMNILPSPRTNKQTIYPHGNGNSTSLEVLCDFETDGGGWTVIQKRSRGPKQEFNQIWNEYVKGFGSLDKNFWLGLDNIHTLTKNGDQELRIELEDFEGNQKYAKYSRFSVSGDSDSYRLSISGYSGTAGDSMTNPTRGLANNGYRFSTKDKDHDNCLQSTDRGAWWRPAGCSYSGLNGLYLEKREISEGYRGIGWYYFKQSWTSLAKSEMKIRPKKS